MKYYVLRVSRVIGIGRTRMRIQNGLGRYMGVIEVNMNLLTPTQTKDFYSLYDNEKYVFIMVRDIEKSTENPNDYFGEMIAFSHNLPTAWVA